MALALETYRRGVEELKQMQADLQQNAASQQTLMQQAHENEMVLAELERLEDGDGEGDGEEGGGDLVFKLMGPALVRQDRAEAVATISKRLGFIKGELARLEEGAKGLEGRMDEARGKLAALQAEAIAAQGGDGGGGGGGGSSKAAAAAAAAAAARG